MTKLNKLKKGEFFKRKEGAKAIYQKGVYERSNKRYECSDVEDMNRFIYVAGSKEVFIEFEY